MKEKVFLSEAQRSALRKDRQGGMTAKELVAKYGVTESTIWRALAKRAKVQALRSTPPPTRKRRLISDVQRFAIVADAHHLSRNAIAAKHKVALGTVYNILARHKKNGATASVEVGGGGVPAGTMLITGPTVVEKGDVAEGIPEIRRLLEERVHLSELLKENHRQLRTLVQKHIMENPN